MLIIAPVGSYVLMLWQRVVSSFTFRLYHVPTSCIVAELEVGQTVPQDDFDSYHSVQTCRLGNGSFALFFSAYGTVSVTGAFQE